MMHNLGLKGSGNYSNTCSNCRRC